MDTRVYSQLAYGYAATVHKSQGITVDRAHMLASRFVDRHAAYVGMSRHRQQADLYWSREEFKTFDRLAATASRDQRKDTTLDYLRRAETGEQSPRESLRASAAKIWQEIKGTFRFQAEPTRPPRMEPTFTREEVRRAAPHMRPQRVDPAFAKETIRQRVSSKQEQKTQNTEQEIIGVQQRKREQGQSY